MRQKKAKALRQVAAMTTKEGPEKKQAAYKNLKRLYKAGTIK